MEIKHIIKKEKKFLFLIFILSFLVRLFFFQFFLLKNNGHWVCSDSAQYHKVAVQIASGNGVVDDYGKPTIYRVPGFSFFLSLFYKLFNFDITITLLVQIFLSSFIPVLVFLLSLTFFPSFIFIAKLASFFMVFNLGSVLHAGLMMSDSLFLLLFLIFLISFFYGLSCLNPTGVIPACPSKPCAKTGDTDPGSNPYYRYFWAGLLLGIISLVRPVGQFLLIVSIFILLFSNYAWKDKIKAISLFVLAWFFVIFGWLFRNYLNTNQFVLHSMSGYHFLTYFAAEVEAKNEGISYYKAKNKLLDEWNNICESEETFNVKDNLSNEVARDMVAQGLASKYLLKNKVQTLKHAVINIFKTIFGLNSSYLLFINNNTLPEYGTQTTFLDKIKRFIFPKTENLFLTSVIYFEILFLLLMLFGFLFNIFVSFYEKSLFCNNLKILPIIGVLIFLTLGSGVARLRLPVEPIFIIFATKFYVDLFRRIRF